MSGQTGARDESRTLEKGKDSAASRQSPEIGHLTMALATANRQSSSAPKMLARPSSLQPAMPWVPLPSLKPCGTSRFQSSPLCCDRVAHVSQQPLCCPCWAHSPAESSGGGLRALWTVSQQDVHPHDTRGDQSLRASRCLVFCCEDGRPLPPARPFAAGHFGVPQIQAPTAPYSLCGSRAGKTNQIHSQTPKHTVHRRENHFHLIEKHYQPLGVLMTPCSPGRHNCSREFWEPQMQLLIQCTTY